MFDFATRDLTFAIGHDLLVFLLAGVLAFEVGVIRPSMKREDILRVSRVDNWYGILAAAIIVVGFSRAIYAAKGWAYYEANGFFWAKIAAFAVVGLLSIIPKIQIIRWPTSGRHLKIGLNIARSRLCSHDDEAEREVLN